MKLIKPDPARRIEIPGVAEPVQRPVDIDRSRTNFEKLRSLRIYRFNAGSIIDGHAEEDEVFVVVLAGSIEFAATGALPMEEVSTHFLSAPGDSQLASCAAYLPPNSSYCLTSETESVIAYARATPASGRPPASFQASGLISESPVKNLLVESMYAQQLRLRLFHINSKLAGVDFTPINESEPDGEALIHLQFEAGGTTSVALCAENDSLSVESWDTLAIFPGEHPTFHFPAGSSALALVVLVPRTL